jgi:hypothetical protein
MRIQSHLYLNLLLFMSKSQVIILSIKAKYEYLQVEQYSVFSFSIIYFVLPLDCNPYNILVLIAFYPLYIL